MATATKKRSKKSAKKTAKRPTAKASKRATSKRAETGLLDFDGRYADYAAAHARPCPACGARANKDCVDEETAKPLPLMKIGNALISGMHAARRTLEMDLSVEGLSITVTSEGRSVTLEQLPVTNPPGVRLQLLREEQELWDTADRWGWEDYWPSLNGVDGVEAPTLDLGRSGRRQRAAPWLRVRSRIDGADVVGYAMETTQGACIRVHSSIGTSWGIPVSSVDLETARWWTTRDEVEAGLLEAGYRPAQVAEFLKDTGWESKSKRAKGGKVPVACLDCEHPECPIVPDCSGCPTCAAERAGTGAAKLEEFEAGAEGPGSSAPVDSSSVIVWLSDLRRDGGTQPRAAMDPSVIEEYAEAYRSEAQLPPLIAYYDGEVYWLADGFHRAAALELAGLNVADVDVRMGTRRDAVLYSCGANAAHGLRRTRADRRRAVETLLRDEEWGKCTDRWIAERCGVSPTTVGTIRAELVGSGEVSKLDTREGRDGKAYTVPEREPSNSAEPDASRDPRGDASSAGESDALEEEGPPRLRRCGLTGRKQCSECGARWPDEVLPGLEDGDPPAACPHCQVRAPELRDPGAEALIEAAEAWTAKRRRGEVPELDPPAGGQFPAPSDEADASPLAGARIEPIEPGGGSQGDPRPPDGSQSDPGGSQSDPPRTAKRSWRDVLELPPGRIDPMLVIEHHVRLSSALGLTDEERAELDRARAFGLSQWQTMPGTANDMVCLAGLAGMDRPSVLEPSAGGGALVAAIRGVCGRDAHITAHEIDPVYAERLRKAPSHERADVIHEGDFLAVPIPSRRYDVAILNSPYEGGADGAFLARCMDAANAVVALVRLNALTGSGRYELVWSRVQASGEWCLSDLHILTNRPEFEGPGDLGAKSDYAIVRLLRTEAHAGAGLLTKVEWP